MKFIYTNFGAGFIRLLMYSFLMYPAPRKRRVMAINGRSLDSVIIYVTLQASSKGPSDP